ncbi:type VI secretion system ATPase TssH [Acidisoma cellulosilytica]|uniref:Type VI secretion system ATPase TssH n=1 Tax=Acidisoma cellulosilyticum TaxID=2802395 RepID=A0A963Z1B7_9PROT|nr:type VI secretion system ATPase TssH [Acidisoma cellulosilyticum]MCB8881047.1 type VI secretion system ATPase TssH [Acidisoma cellulosilyticum]
MATLDLSMLVARLNDTCRKSLESAAGLTVSRTHYNVELEHWLLRLTEAPGSDIPAIMRHFDIDAGRVIAGLNAVLDGMKTGNGRAPSLSPELVRMIKQAWLVGSIARDALTVRSADVLLAILDDESLSSALRRAVPQLSRLPAGLDHDQFAAVLAGNAEADRGSNPRLATDAAAADMQPPAPSGPHAALDTYTVDLTRRARDGAIDPIVGRDIEIRQMIDILTRRRQNNPILVGEAGVGKTAVVEALALRVAAGDVPQSLATASIRTLDLGLLQAGAGVKGEFENRLRGVMRGVEASPFPVILFVDEAHTLVGAGGASGTGDAANLLKPALARGQIRMIAATTWAEYKKYFEKDAALTRRFQPVIVEEPDEPAAIAMIRGLVATLETHHDIPIMDDAVIAAVRLSARYIPSRQLPDKAVSLLDTACARVAMTQENLPAALEDVSRRLGLIVTEYGVLSREVALGDAHDGRMADLEEEREALLARETELMSRWQSERALVGDLRVSRQALLADATAGLSALPAASDSARDRYRSLRQELGNLQGDYPLVFPVVDAQAVAEVVADWTGIPVGRMRSDEVRTILDLQSKLAQRIVGQDHALSALTKAIQTSRAGLTDPRKPVGVFLMVGTSGTGKTETALALAELLFGDEQTLTVINMSEFKEEHKVSLLMGSPPGYIGYGEGGILTEAVRRRPYSVILLDEMEKAHPGVQDIFYQVFDKGHMMDGEGRAVDFKNTVIVMTSNAGSEMLSRLFADPDTAPEPESLPALMHDELVKTFKPAFLGRVRLLPYLPMTATILRSIVTLQLDRLTKRFQDRYGSDLIFEPSVIDAIAERCTENAIGARAIEAILSDKLLPDLSVRMLGQMSDKHMIETVVVDLDVNGAFRYAMNRVS